jgi:hypothetical protein
MANGLCRLAHFHSFTIWSCDFKLGNKSVITLALGLWQRQGLAKVQAKSVAWESHSMLLAVYKSVKEWTLTLPSELPFWELESRWIPKFLMSDCKGKKPLDYEFPYIIRKLLNANA